MAELRIQRKKTAPSPWLLVGLAGLLLAAAAYFFLRPDPVGSPPPAAAPVATTPADSLAPGSPAGLARATPPPAADSLAATPAVGAPSDSARTALLQLGAALVQLTDRADLRADAGIREQRDNFTSATARLSEAAAPASLRPGLVAVANLLLAVQQKAYPALETPANELVRQAGQLSGRTATPTEQAQTRQYLAQAAALLDALSQPPSATL